MLKSVLALTLLGLSACKTLKDPPEYWLCQVNGTPRAFYCVNSRTGECIKDVRGNCAKIAIDHPAMRASQCVSADDYKTLQAYVDYLIQQAERRCK